MIWLCKLGIHKWEHIFHREWDDGFTSGGVHDFMCKRCGKIEK